MQFFGTVVLVPANLPTPQTNEVVVVLFEKIEIDVEVK
jgi:hypothetical protein